MASVTYETLLAKDLVCVASCEEVLIVGISKCFDSGSSRHDWADTKDSFRSSVDPADRLDQEQGPALMTFHMPLALQLINGPECGAKFRLDSSGLDWHRYLTRKRLASGKYWPDY